MTFSDSTPDPWKSKSPDPSQEELRLLSLAKLYVQSDRAVQEKIGTTSVCDYRRLTDERRKAIEELLNAASSYRRK